MFRITPPRIVTLSFLGAILLGTVILCLPVSVRPGENVEVIDALFTATSAACVTGLTVKDTGSFFSGFGQVIILCLVQAGGLGIMTFSTVFAVMLGKKLSLKQNLIIQSTVGEERRKGIVTLLKYIVLLTVGFELAGTAALLMLGFNLKSAVFHTVCAFCNAGFGLYRNNLVSYQGNIPVNLIIIALIIAGGLGFVVLLELPKLRFWFSSNRRQSMKLSLQAKLALSVSLALIVLGAAAILVFETKGVFAGLPLKNKLCVSFFQSVSARTAGFNTIDINELSIASKLFLIFLMFIGASPGSTGGGIKTVTLAIIIAGLWSMIKNRPYGFIFKRKISSEVLTNSLVVFFLSLGWICAFSLILSVTEPVSCGGPDVFVNLLFEITSAFGTVGLSAGITPGLSVLGKLIIIITMFLGRVGPLTLALAVALHKQTPSFSYPEEKVMVG